MTNVNDILEKKGRDVAVIGKDATVLEAARLMRDRQIGAVVVAEEGAILGIFTERDLLNRVVGAGRDVAATRIGEVMTAPIATCRGSISVAECEARMSQLKVRHLPVVEDGKLLGMISSRDVLAWRVETSEHAVEQLSEYLYGRV